jgi:hypothetical protein
VPGKVNDYFIFEIIQLQVQVEFVGKIQIRKGKNTKAEEHIGSAEKELGDEGPVR